MTRRYARATRRLRRLLDILATVLVIAASLGVLITLLRGSDAPPGSAGFAPTVAPGTPLTHSLSGAQLLGNPKAPLALVQYSDFECPYCIEFATKTWPQFRAKYVDTGKVLAVFRHLPLPSHPHAKIAAISANCAGRQGQFWQMHDRLFGVRGSFDDVPERSFALGLGIDVAQYEQCLAAPSKDDLTNDGGFAAANGIDGTPTFLVGTTQPDQTVMVTQILPGIQSLAELSEALNSALPSTNRR